MSETAAVVPRPPTVPPADIRAASLAARVRVGASPATPPQLLLELARDPAVTVRAAVAMNPASPGPADRVLLDDADTRVRALLARRLAGLIPTLPRAERDALREQVMASLEFLVQDEAERVRAAIADVVKDMPEASRELILRLAHDSALSVSEPVIRLSPLLSAEDLLGLLASAHSPFVARTVASRPGLPEPVCDAIAAGADNAAIRALLCNPTAAIREATLDGLIERAAEVMEWHAPLVRRPRLSPRAARALSEIVTTQLLGELATRGDLGAALTEQLRQRLAARQLQASASDLAEPDSEAAMAEARRLKSAHQLNEATVLVAVQRGEARRAAALLAVAADVPNAVVDRAARLRSAKGIVSLVWRAGFSMRVAGPLQLLLARLAPDSVLPANFTGSFPLAVEEMRWQIDFLSRTGR